MEENKMTKEDYLRKKGVLPNENLGTLFVFKSSPEGVEEIVEHTIWSVKRIKHKSYVENKSTHSVSSSSVKGLFTENHEAIRYELKESPFNCEIEFDKIIGENSGHGSGFGDLWCWSYYFSKDREVLEKKRQEEIKRVDEKYLFKKRNERQIFVEFCRSIVRLKGVEGRRELFLSTQKPGTIIIVYEDDVIKIKASKNDLSMEIIRKENSNPVVYVDPSGEIYRSHGEQSHLFNHVRNIISDL